MLALKSACLRFSQPEKALYSIRFSDAGAVKDLSPELENAYGPRTSSPSLGLTDCNAFILQKASCPTSVTARGKVYVFASFPEIISLTFLLVQISLIVRTQSLLFLLLSSVSPFTGSRTRMSFGS